VLFAAIAIIIVLPDKHRQEIIGLDIKRAFHLASQLHTASFPGNRDRLNGFLAS
jgi:hypothetical protein